MALLVLLAMPASGQIQNGIFTGTVSDPQGASVPSAEVAITNAGTNYTLTVKTSTEGVYRAAELPVGTYRITVTASGFKKAVKSNLYLGAGVIERVDFTLEIGQMTETVTVEAGAVAVQTDDSKLTETIGAGQVANLPLNGRNVFDLIQLAPGAVDVTGVSFENGHSTVVNGLRPNFNGFLVNGVSDKGLSGGVVTVPNADIVQEFQELTLNMSAQYGNSAAAIVNVVTKSGTNTFHGSVYEFFRNDKLDANEFFRNQLGFAKPELRYNQFGGTLTGPIWKDRLFFTASYQGDRFVTAAPPTPITSESAAWRQVVINFLPNTVAAKLYHDFPTVSDGTPLISKGTGLPETVNDFVAANYGNYLPLVCPSSFAANFAPGFGYVVTRFQQLFGVTAAEAIACGGGLVATGATSARTTQFERNNALQFGSQTLGNLFDGNEWSSRIDWVRKNDRVFGEYYWQHTFDTFGPGNASSGIHGFKNPTGGHFPNFQASWVHTFSPNWLNEARAGYVLNRTDTSVAVPGVPSVAFDNGTAGFGSYNGYPQFFHENIYTYSDMMSFVRGRHSIKTGVDFRRNIENSEFNIARPSYYFFDQLFFAVDAPYGGAAGADPGFITSSPAQLADNFRHWRNLEIGGYIQDDWKVRRNLTINVGLRYDLYTRHTELSGKVTTFIPGPGCQFPANGYCADAILNANSPANCLTPDQVRHVVLAGVCGPGGFAVANSLGKGNYKNFGPRVGFSYDPFSKGKTAIRAGFGISYEGTLYNPLSNSRWNPPFYSFNNFGNALGGGTSVAVYGPTATCNGVTVTAFCPAGRPAGTAACDYTTTACLPSGAAVTYTGPPANPGIGVGAQGTGNIQGYGSENPNLATLTGIVFPEGIRDPHIFNYYFGIQHEILPKTVLEVNYVGTMGRKLFRAEQGNRLVGDRLPVVNGVATCVVIQDGSTVCGRGRRRLNPDYGRLRIWDNVSKSWYNGLQVAVRHQTTRGFAFNLAYAWSHSIDTGSDWHSGATSANGAAAGDGYSLDVQRPLLDKGNSTFDIRHRLTFNYVYEFPWHKDQRGFIGHVVGGWQYNGIWAFQSGAHFTPYCPAGNRCDFNFDGERNDRPDAPNGNHFDVSKDQWANGWFNVPGSSFGCAWVNCAVGTVPFFSTPCRACDGNLGRNTFEGPGLFSTDQSVFKNIRLTERFSFQFRTEIFNTFNRANFLLPSSSTGANFANQITAGNFGQSAGTQRPRLIQFALKLLF